MDYKWQIVHNNPETRPQNDTDIGEEVERKEKNKLNYLYQAQNSMLMLIHHTCKCLLIY